MHIVRSPKDFYAGLIYLGFGAAGSGSGRVTPWGRPGAWARVISRKCYPACWFCSGFWRWPDLSGSRVAPWGPFAGSRCTQDPATASRDVRTSLRAYPPRTSLLCSIRLRISSRSSSPPQCAPARGSGGAGLAASSAEIRDPRLSRTEPRQTLRPGASRPVSATYSE